MTEDKDQAASAEEADERNESSENKRPDDTLAANKKCPECGEPIDDVRATCINCGYEYKDEDHEDLEAGTEFVAGSQIDDEGNEIPDEEPPAEAEGSSDDDEEKT